jgi:hypothetical protein
MKNRRRIRRFAGRLLWAAFSLIPAGVPLAFLSAAPSSVTYRQSAETVDAYDFVEVTLDVKDADVGNAFTEATVRGQFSREGAADPIRVDGFCDSLDGGTFCIRFMPVRPGDYTYSVEYVQGGFSSGHRGTFTARRGNRRGLVRVDKEHPWHFVWEGTGEHYFWNGTTTYWLMGWDDEQIRKNIDRLAALKVNRMRVAINGRVKNGRAWYENVFPTEKFAFLLDPWVAAQPENVERPGNDVTRFNVPYWRKIERMLSHAREKDMVISVIFYVDGARPGVDPFGKSRMGNEDEQRYYRYAVARFAAFSNVLWDVTNEYHLFRNEAWTDKMGALIKSCDPYDHLTSVHGHGDFPFRRSAWADFAMYQQWDESGGYDFILRRRNDQLGTGRIIPQVNEEYGYEDHYPVGWGGGRTAPSRSAENRRRLAWGMYMAGGYQTTGERADRGTGWGPDSGGGWLNGRGDDTMIMLRGYAHIVDFFTSIRWWELDPDPAFIEESQGPESQPKLTHIVYTRSASGEAVVYINGTKKAEAMVSGDFTNWVGDFRLALGNELTRDRPWVGELHRVAIYDCALTPAEVATGFKEGVNRMPAGALVAYNFREGRGDTIRDVSERGEPLNLKIEDASAVKWLPGGGLAIEGPGLIASPGPAAKVNDGLKKSRSVTIDAWIKPGKASQTGPARIVSVSRDTGNRNFTLGQKERGYEIRLRTTRTSPNGEPSLSSAGGQLPLTKICGLRSEEGDLAVVYFPIGGEIKVKPGSLKEGVAAKWFNPRTGAWGPAEARQGGVYRAPDEEDWALLFGGGK